jgi:hypothetical protein
MKNYIIILCILGIFFYVLQTSGNKTEDKLYFIVGYICFMIISLYLLNKPSRMKKEQRK